MERQRIYDRDIKFDDKDREIVISKSGGKCSHCGIEVFIGNPKHIHEDHVFTIDHYIPLIKGGTNVMVNLVPLCHKCNEKKGALIIDPRNYLKHIDEKHLNDITGMYEGYIKSFDYLSRNNFLANDIYEYTLPKVLDPRKLRGPRHKRLKVMEQQQGKGYIMHRANLDMVPELCSYYKKYLEKYKLMDSPEALRANILYWLVNGCIYFVRDKQGVITAMVAITIFRDNPEYGFGDYCVRMLPFFYYSNEKYGRIFGHLTGGIAHTIVEENNIPFISVEVAVVQGDSIIQNSVLWNAKPDDESIDSRFIFYDTVALNFNMMPEGYEGKDAYTKYNEIEKENGKDPVEPVNTFYKKILGNSKALYEYIHEEIYPPFSYSWNNEKQGYMLDREPIDQGKAAKETE